MPKFNRTQICADNNRNKKDAMRIALSAMRFSVYIRVQKGNSHTINLHVCNRGDGPFNSVIF